MMFSDIAKKILAIAKKDEKREPFIIGIDGRCTSGKTTLASAISALCNCSVIHTDDFYLPKSKRSATATEVGSHMDFARLEAQLSSLREKKDAFYRPYICKTDSFGEQISVRAEGIIILEGSYSHHPVLKKHLDLAVFLSVEQGEQARRVRLREGERADAFFKKWIPEEERYHSAFDVKLNADISFDT